MSVSKRMQLAPDHTIFALATAPGRGAIAVIRISGAVAFAALQQLTAKPLPAPRMAQHLQLYHPTTQTLLDDVIVTCYAAPASFTGEDTVEIACHGGRATITAILDALGTLPGLRLAQPGEFTRRAFDNDKLDLTQAEAINDLINAETSLQRAQALNQLSGALSQLYHDWAARLTRCLAYAEAVLDFPDEELPDDLWDKLSPQLSAITAEIAAHLNDAHKGERLRDGIQIAIIGAPNAGKSTLLNALAQREVAIVSAVPGTTRDVLEVHLDLGGYPVVLADTAGLRNSENLIEAIGIDRARQRAAQADIKLLLFDSTQVPDTDTLSFMNDDAIVVFTKKDLRLEAGGWTLDKSVFPASSLQLPISAQTGEGLPQLLTLLTKEITQRYDRITETPTLTRARHRDALTDAHDCLLRARDARYPELLAEDLRLAVRAIGRITGRVDVEDLLDIIFRDFCIGK